jgi:hypothetical protein
LDEQPHDKVSTVPPFGMVGMVERSGMAVPFQPPASHGNVIAIAVPFPFPGAETWSGTVRNGIPVPYRALLPFHHSILTMPRRIETITVTVEQEERLKAFLEKDAISEDSPRPEKQG